MTEVRERRDAHHRTRVDDRAGATLDHRRGERGRKRKWAPQVRLEELACLVAITRDPSQPLHARAGVVDQDVYLPEIGDGALGDLGRPPAIAEVGIDDNGPRTARCL